MTEENSKKRYTADEKVKIVLESLTPGANKSEICRRYGIYSNQLIRWTENALKGAAESVDRKNRTNHKKGPADYYEKELAYWKQVVLEVTAENQLLKKKRVGD